MGIEEHEKLGVSEGKVKVSGTSSDVEPQSWSYWKKPD